jgi:hypothetical protein
MNNSVDAKQSFLILDAPSQARVLARVAHMLTIHARESYEVGTDGVNDTISLRRSNEVMHRLTSQICALLEGDEKRFPDEVILRIIDGLHVGSDGRLLGKAIADDHAKNKKGEQDVHGNTH